MSASVKAPDKPLTIAVAGYGKMGSAMVKTWASSPFVAAIDVLDPFPLIEDIPHKDKVTGYTEAAVFVENADQWDILVLAVKPQSMDNLCKLLSLARKDLPVISIAAGKKMEYFTKQFGDHQPIIRVMPNTPASIGQGMSVAIASHAVTDIVREHTKFLFTCLGKFEWIDDEGLMDAVTALSGSGPAYVFYMIEALTEAGVKSGLPYLLADTLARQTVIGAAALANDDADTTPAKLRENVTSPNGTTAAALVSLMDGRFQELINEAVAKATLRGKELSQ